MDKPPPPLSLDPARMSLNASLVGCLQPQGAIESILVDAIADRLERLLRASRSRHPGAGRRCAAHRPARQLLDLMSALEKFRALTTCNGPSPTAPPAAAAPAVVPLDEALGSPADVASLWRERLVFDPAVCPASPIIVGSRITVREVVSLVVDGWTWADIRRAYPRLDDADIRACLAYCVEEEGGAVAYH